MTYTYAVLEVSPSAYGEIEEKLREAGYEHAFHDDGDGPVIDMHGIALRTGPLPDRSCPCGVALVRNGKILTCHWQGGICSDCHADIAKEPAEPCPEQVPDGPPTIDLMAALKESLRGGDAESINRAAVSGDSPRDEPPPGVYMASRTRHAAKWRDLRDSGYPVASSWIDEGGSGQTADYSDLMRRCIAEAASAAAMIVYAEGDDISGWKGVWFEMGAACATGVPVYFAGTHDFPSALRHPDVLCCDSLEDALALALAKQRAALRGDGPPQRERIACGHSHPDARLNADIDAFRESEGGPLDTAGCGAAGIWPVMYRCVECARWFHRDCIRKHFAAHRGAPAQSGDGPPHKHRRPTDEPPPDHLRQAWPWTAYTTAYGLRIRHGITGTELDLYEAARKLNDYDSAWRSVAPPTEERK